MTLAAARPNEAWVYNQVKAFAPHAPEFGLNTNIVMHDRDTKFTAKCDSALKDAGLEGRQRARAKSH